jgi:hypothetical protein
MGNLILLLVAAAWAAVLVPPLVRSRLRNSPNTSVTQFRRQLSSLQQGGRGLSRSGSLPVGSMRSPLRDAARPFAPAARAVGRPLRQVGHATSSVVRPRGTRQHDRFEGEFFERELIRRRRQNWLLGLAGTTGMSLLLALAMREMFFVWTFTVAALATAAYCYVLVQWRVKRDHERYRRQFRRVA